MLPYLAVIAACFLLVPLLAGDTGTAILLLLIALPLVCLGAGAVYGYRNGFDAIFALIVAVLFVPIVFLFMNSTALPYVFVYGAAALAGDALGRFIKKGIK
jgi:hypothetical protein